MKRMPCCREYLPSKFSSYMENFLKAFQGQSHRAGHRHSIHFSAKEMSRRLKDFLRKDGVCLNWETSGRGEIFIENKGVCNGEPTAWVKYFSIPLSCHR